MRSPKCFFSAQFVHRFYRCSIVANYQTKCRVLRGAFTMCSKWSRNMLSKCIKLVVMADILFLVLHIIVWYQINWSYSLYYFTHFGTMQLQLQLIRVQSNCIQPVRDARNISCHALSSFFISSFVIIAINVAIIHIAIIMSFDIIAIIFISGVIFNTMISTVTLLSPLHWQSWTIYLY